MKKMPYEIKQKLRQYHKANMKAKNLHSELVEIFEVAEIEEVFLHFVNRKK